MHKPWQALGVAAYLAACVPLMGQTDSTRIEKLDEVVVSDTRFPLRWEQSGKTVIRLSRRELASYRGATMAEILNAQTGIEISGSRGRPGEVLGVFARGGRGRQVLVLIDGVRVTDPSSASQEYDLRFVQAEEVESVEILKGAASTLYGTNAATAVINIRTRKAPKSPLALRVGSLLGTHRAPEDPEGQFGQYQQYARLGGTSGRLNYQAGITHARATGLSSLRSGTETDPFRNLSLSARLGYRPWDHTRVQLTANRTQLRTAYDDAFNGADADFLFLSEQTRVSLNATREFSKGTLEARAGYSEFDSDNRSDFPTTFRGSNWFGEVLYKHRLNRSLSVLGGIMASEDRAGTEDVESFRFIDPFVNLVWASASGWNLNAGTRVNFHSQYGSQWVYQLNPSYALTLGEHTFKALATWSTAYITPTLNQLYGTFGANPELEPETDRTLEAGLAWQFGNRMRLSVLYFDREEEQAVIYDGAGMQYRNSPDPVEVNGVEFEATWFAADGWQVRAGYTYTDRQGDAAIRIPAHKFQFRLNGEISSRWRGSLYYRYTGTRTDTDFSTFTNRELDAFSLVGGQVGYSFLRGKLDAYLRADNLLNTEFTEVIGYQTPGRTIYLGWSLQLD
ncbi:MULTISPECIES: TonB-dependent receptor plug domain-containing protein [Robiginitalea]|nr:MULTISPECIES: TonB-dependent receptor [Robiginitalea]MDC6355060.1 TonB-dependent receptor plug domain-containing protein [Robiginitalea sp. PM2]MDC6375327.1 TonB-dependent receptor plug domain-containing protein [Robiginitalea sp. SP8]